MNKLPADFKINKYGLNLRLVNKEDAEFILRLRTNDKLSKYIHKTEDDISKQIEWIGEYKNREKDGTEYYFIFFKDEIPVGLNRIYNIKGDIFTTGSWIFDNEAPLECSIASAIIVREIAFEMLGMSMENGYDGCHKDNVKVLRFNKMIGLKVSGQIEDSKGTYITMTLTKENFERNKSKLINLLNLK